MFCVEKAKEIDHKDSQRLRRFVTDRGKILPRRVSGNCAKHQRLLAVAIKRARELALLPYTGE
jgi:small subunit ribosomal protein S18